MAHRFVYDGHGHRVEIGVGAWGFGRARFFLDGREVGPVTGFFRRQVEFTTRDEHRTVPWKVDARSGSYGELQVRVWRNGQLVSGWS